MELIITSAAALAAFIIFFAVFLIKRPKKDGAIRVKSCAREECSCEKDRRTALNQEHLDCDGHLTDVPQGTKDPEGSS